MEDLIIEPTRKTLTVICSEGKILMEGCSITNDPKVFFKPVIDWMQEYAKSSVDYTEIVLNFEYIDTASVKYVYQILQEFIEAKAQSHKIKVKWYYDIDDPEILELGEIIDSKLDAEFEFIDYQEEDLAGTE
jgi:hypothetical protein